MPREIASADAGIFILISLTASWLMVMLTRSLQMGKLKFQQESKVSYILLTC